jgi:hypothetical protein
MNKNPGNTHFFAQGQNWRAASTTNASFRRSSSTVTGLPATVLANPHCGPIASRSRSM